MRTCDNCACDRVCDHNWNGFETCGNWISMDAVPVVRCRECKHCDPENYHCDHHMGTAAPLRREPDDFCSYGEKRCDEDGTT